jgi:hypothetical protein
MLAACGALATAAGAALLPGPPTGFGITPARRHVVGYPAMALSPTTVTNRTPTSYRVTVFPALLTQDLSGAFEFVPTARNLSDSKVVLSAWPSSFTLQPGQSRQVGLRWNLLPLGRKWVAIGVVFQGVPQGQGTPVHVITRLLSVNFLRLPGVADIQGAFTRLYAQQYGARALELLARVKNSGDRFWAPSDGQLVVRDRKGRVVLRQRWTGDVVLPGASRDFPILIRKVLPAGTYTATVSMTFGHRRRRSTTFTLVAPNRLPSPALTIRHLNASGTANSPARVTADVVSSGTAPASVAIDLYLSSANQVPGQAATATARVVYRALAAGRVAHLSRPLGRALKTGRYRVTAHWVDPMGLPHVLQVAFSATPQRSFWEEGWGHLKRHAVLFGGLLLLFMMAAMAFLAHRMIARERQIEAELAAARAQLEASLHSVQHGITAGTDSEGVRWPQG